MNRRHTLSAALTFAIVFIALFASAGLSVIAEEPEAAEEPEPLFGDIEPTVQPITAGPEFTVPNEFSIATPSGGYEWKLVRTAEFEGVEGKWYSCMKPGTTSGIVLAIEGRTADAGPARIGAVKGHYNALVTGLTQGGFTDLDVKQPSLKEPVPERLEYSVDCKKPTGEKMFIRGLTIFGGRIYSFQIVAMLKTEADDLLAIAKTFKELSPAQNKAWRGKVAGNEFVVPEEFSIETPGNGYEWSLAQTQNVKGVAIRTYVCMKKGSPSAIVLTVHGKQAATEADRQKAVREHSRGLRGQLDRQQYTDIQERPPNMKSPIGERVSFALRGKDREGKMTYVFGLTVLGKNVYALHLLSPSQDEARQLYQVINSFKELAGGE